jgi:hypothetical protein
MRLFQTYVRMFGMAIPNITAAMASTSISSYNVNPAERLAFVGLMGREL